MDSPQIRSNLISQSPLGSWVKRSILGAICKQLLRNLTLPTIDELTLTSFFRILVSHGLDSGFQDSRRVSSRDADDDDTVDWPWAIRSLRFFSAAACVSVGVTLLNRTKDSGLPIRASLSHFRPNYRFNFPVFITKPEDAKIGFLFSPVTFFLDYKKSTAKLGTCPKGT